MNKSRGPDSDQHVPVGFVVDVADMTDEEIEALAEALVDWQDERKRERRGPG